MGSAMPKGTDLMSGGKKTKGRSSFSRRGEEAERTDEVDRSGMLAATDLNVRPVPFSAFHGRRVTSPTWRPTDSSTALDTIQLYGTMGRTEGSLPTFRICGAGRIKGQA